MKFFILLLAILSYGSLVFVSCDNNLNNNLNIQAWSGSAYPKPENFPEKRTLDAKGLPSTALSISGGGTTAFNIAMGVLSVLNDNDLLKYVRYLGGVSGGGWAASVYTYTQNTKNDKVFLGPIVQPKDINDFTVNTMDPNCARSFTTRCYTSCGLAAFNNQSNNANAQTATTDTIYDIYFSTIGVPKNAIFTYNATTRASILKRNPSLVNETFLLPAKPSRPFMLISFALVGPSYLIPIPNRSQLNISFQEMSSMYFGSPKLGTVSYNKGAESQLIGGYMESYIFGANASKTGLKPGGVAGTLSVPAPSSLFSSVSYVTAGGFVDGSLFLSTQFPAKYYWGERYFSPSQVIPKPAVTNQVTDGGFSQNTMVAPFLQRGIKNIIAVFSTSVPLQPASVWNVNKNPKNIDYITSDLACLFGALPDGYASIFNYQDDQVFSFSDWPRVVKTLQAAQAKGNGIIATFQLTTVHNDWWGINAGFKTSLTIIYNGRLKNWEKQLNAKYKALLVPAGPDASDLGKTIQTGPYLGFPNYPVTGGDLTNGQANLGADLVSLSFTFFNYMHMIFSMYVQVILS